MVCQKCPARQARPRAEAAEALGIQLQDYDKADNEQGDVMASRPTLKRLESALLAEEMVALRWDVAKADASRLPLAERAALETLRGEFRLKASEYPAEYP